MHNNDLVHRMTSDHAFVTFSGAPSITAFCPTTGEDSVAGYVDLTAAEWGMTLSELERESENCDRTRHFMERFRDTDRLMNDDLARLYRDLSQMYAEDVTVRELASQQATVLCAIRLIREKMTQTPREKVTEVEINPSGKLRMKHAKTLADNINKNTPYHATVVGCPTTMVPTTMCISSA
jgi:hypothetical protein